MVPLPGVFGVFQALTDERGVYCFSGTDEGASDALTKGLLVYRRRGPAASAEVFSSGQALQAHPRSPPGASGNFTDNQLLVRGLTLQ